jgi:hypothetical protein
LVYIKTNIESLNNVLKNEISNNENIEGITDDFNKCSVAIVSASSKEEIDKLVDSNKNLVLFLSPNRNDLREYALEKGIKYVYVGECSISDIVYVAENMIGKPHEENLLNSVLNNENKTKSEIQPETRQEMKPEVKQEIRTDTRLEINPEIKQPDAMTLEEITVLVGNYVEKRINEEKAK